MGLPFSPLSIQSAIIHLPSFDYIQGYVGMILIIRVAVLKDAYWPIVTGNFAQYLFPPSVPPLQRATILNIMWTAAMATSWKF